MLSDITPVIVIDLGVALRAKRPVQGCFTVRSAHGTAADGFGAVPPVDSYLNMIPSFTAFDF